MTEPTEAHGCNHLNRVDRAIHEMLGVVRGILFDGKITDDEVTGLNNWLLLHADIRQVWPVFVISERLYRILSDGKIDDEERAELKDMLAKLVGGGLNRATSLPVDDPLPALLFPEKRYVFTGKFAFGTRKACEGAVADCGALCSSAVSCLTDYLVIGEIGSADWKYSAWGNKIHEAMQLKSDGEKIAIIPEEHWAMSLRA